MCGIAGQWGREFALEDLEKTLSRMLSAIAHRGPDGAAIALSKQGGLGHVRLSIIDLEHGHQPMVAEDHGLWITYNGELFNYLELRHELEQLGERFTTQSDTEVVLRAYARWGKRCCERFNGQYAFAIASPKDGNLFLARDPFGERPLFWHRNGRHFSFCSEIKGLLTCPHVSRALDLDALHSVAGSWSLQPTQTSFQGIHQCPPGYWMNLAEGELSSGPHYALPEMSDHQLNQPELQEACMEELQKSVKLRLRSDVEVGTYLSGGLDSSVTTALARQNLDHVHSFSVAFNHNDYDESPEQELASQHLKTEHHRLCVDEKAIADIFPKVVYHAECPQFRTASAPLYLLAAHVREQNLKVVLTGEGADEFFLGYNIFKEVQLRQNLGNMSDEQAVKAISQLYPYLPHFDEANARKQLPLFRRSCRDPDDLLFSHRMRFGTSQWTESFLAPGASAMNQWRESLSGWHGYQNRGPLGRAQELERLNLLHGYLLSSQGDRMGMAHGVEARCPFLDPKVVAFAQNCALESKLSGNTNEKAILKEAFKTLLPHQITARPKQPYRAMEAQCFIKSKPDWYLEAVDHQQLKHYDWLLPEKASFLFKKAELAYEKLSPREHQSLTFILSTVLLDHKFIKHMYAPQHNLGISILHMKT